MSKFLDLLKICIEINRLYRFCSPFQVNRATDILLGEAVQEFPEDLAGLVDEPALTRTTNRGNERYNMGSLDQSIIDATPPGSAVVNMQEEEFPPEICQMAAVSNVDQWLPSGTAGCKERRDVDLNLPPGLQNVGNTCYVNSLLQTLYWIKPFRTALVDAMTRASASSSRVPANQRNAVSLVLQLSRLFSMLEVSNRKSITPRLVINPLIDSNVIPKGTQEDVSEFTSKFFELLENNIFQF